MARGQLCGLVGLVLEIGEPVMTSKMVAFLKGSEGCLDLAKYVTLPTSSEKKTPLSTEELRASYRAARILSELLLPSLGDAVAGKLAAAACEIFEPTSRGFRHHGCKILEALFQTYPDATYDGLRNVEQLVLLAERDGNCRELLLQLCAPGLRRDVDDFSDDDDDDEFFEEDDDDARATKVKPTPAARARFVEKLGNNRLLPIAAESAPRTLVELLRRLSRRDDALPLLTPLPDLPGTLAHRLDVARVQALLTAASLPAPCASCHKKSVGHLAAQFRRSLMRTHLPTIRSALLEARGLLRCLLLELLVVCLVRRQDEAFASSTSSRLPAAFCVGLCEAFVESKGSVLDALAFELFSWALRRDEMPADVEAGVVRRVLRAALDDDAKPHAVALCAVARLAKPHLHVDEALPLIRRQATLRCFAAPSIAAPPPGTFADAVVLPEDFQLRGSAYAASLGFPPPRRSTDECEHCKRRVRTAERTAERTASPVAAAAADNSFFAVDHLDRAPLTSPAPAATIGGGATALSVEVLSIQVSASSLLP